MISGPESERRAAEFLRRRGYTVLRRNYRAPRGEVDLIARQQNTLCFIEVKSRSSFDYGAPAEAVTAAKQRKIIHAARHYLAGCDEKPEPACRFDVVSLGPQGWELVKDAFQIEE